MPEFTAFGRPTGLIETQKTRPRILIVEDDRDARSGLGQRVRHEGSDPLYATDVHGAIRVARLQKPDLILLDLGLPGGDGYAVMRSLQAMPELASIPIVVLSARDPMVERRRVMEAGAIGFYQKPISNNVLRAAIKHALED
jgi:DNA-binding response OmpR family regulator